VIVSGDKSSHHERDEHDTLWDGHRTAIGQGCRIQGASRDAWPDVLKMIKECNIQNYSIYSSQLDDGNHYLFGYMEYTGNDFAADMAKMAADP